MRFEIILGIIFGALPASACMCVSTTRACEDNIAAEIAFVGRVISTENAPDPSRSEIPQRKVRVAIEEAFRGVTGTEVDVYTSATSCGINFQVGVDYLIYAATDSTSGHARSDACSHTAPLNQSSERIANFREQISNRGTAKIFGHATSDPSDLGLSPSAKFPQVGLTVAAKSGGKSWRTETDKQGNYEFTGLPPGNYELNAALPSDVRDSRTRSLHLSAGTCSRQNFLTEVSGHISGILLDSQGHPVPNTMIDLEGVSPTPQPHPLLWPQTDAQGRFSYKNLSMGRYLMGVRLKAPPGQHDWYGTRSTLPKSYYPGVAEPSQATMIELADGHSIDNIVFQLPPSPRIRLITGRVVDKDGITPEAAEVALLDLDYPSEQAQVDASETASDGAFTLQGVEGRRYAIHAQADHKQNVRHSGVIEIGNQNKDLKITLSVDEPIENCKPCYVYNTGISPFWK